jgi:hypothetical protein
MPSYKSTRSGHSLSIAWQQAAQTAKLKVEPEQPEAKQKQWRTRNRDSQRGVDHKTLTCGAGNVTLQFRSKSELFTPEAYAEYRSWQLAKQKEPVFDAVAYELLRQERNASY